MLIGTYNNKIDEKGRLRMPPKLKDELGTGYYITKGDSNCLYAMSKSAFEQLFQKLQSVNFSDNQSKKMMRIFFSSAFLVEEDNQGRVLLPVNLREYAGIKKDVVVIGAGERVELWSEENWNAYNEDGDFDSLIEGLSKYDL